MSNKFRYKSTCIVIYLREIQVFLVFKDSIISVFISFHYEKNYIFGISITCRFMKKYFQPP